jgi:hypothetical protein
MRRVWKYRVAVIFLLVVLMGGTAAVSVPIMGITLALLIVALVGVLVILFAIFSRRYGVPHSDYANSKPEANSQNSNLRF